MPPLRIAIIDQTGGTKTVVEVPDDIPTRELIPALVQNLGLPEHQGNDPIIYHLENFDPGTGAGNRLSDDQTLAEAGIESGMQFSLAPELIAGRG